MRIDIKCENPLSGGYSVFINGRYIGTWSTWINAEQAAKHWTESPAFDAVILQNITTDTNRA